MLSWDERRGWGTETGTFTYNSDYWEDFRAKDDTPMGRVLTALRRGFVDKQRIASPLSVLNACDVGIGGGAYLEAAGGTGIDINEHALLWLKKRKALWNGRAVDVMTFWDSIEHIPDPDYYLKRAGSWVFLSTPIYKGADDCLASKHYKPGEHLWYFSHAGMVRFMAERGFELKDANQLENDAGREGIGSYAFRR